MAAAPLRGKNCTGISVRGYSGLQTPSRVQQMRLSAREEVRNVGYAV